AEGGGEDHLAMSVQRGTLLAGGELPEMDDLLGQPGGAQRAAVGRKGQAARTTLAAELPPDLARGDVPQPDRLLVPLLARDPHAVGGADAGGHQAPAVRRKTEVGDAGAVALELADFLAGAGLVETGEPVPAPRH